MYMKFFWIICCIKLDSKPNMSMHLMTALTNLEENKISSFTSYSDGTKYQIKQNVYELSDTAACRSWLVTRNMS